MDNNQPSWPEQIVEASALWRQWQQDLILGCGGYQLGERKEKLTTLPEITKKKILYSILYTFPHPQIESVPITLPG
jgi:hypothetical protein